MNQKSSAAGNPRTIMVAAVQTPAAQSVSSALDRATPWVEQAATQGAQLVLLPELMATRYVFTTQMWDSAEPHDGPTVQWLRDTSRRLGIWLGTSYLEACGEDFFNTFVLTTPTGAEAGRVRKQSPAMYEPWFFRGEPGSHVIDTELGRIGVGICNDNHRSYLPALLQQGRADLVLMPHCWPLPTQPGGVVSARDLRRWHDIQTGMAPLYARLLGIPAVFVNKVGSYASPAPLRWLPAATGMAFPGHATIADSDGRVVAQMGDREGFITATVTLDSGRKKLSPPRTFGKFVYRAGPAGALVLLPGWLFGRIYQHSQQRRRRALEVSGDGPATRRRRGELPVAEIAPQVFSVGPWGRTQTMVYLVGTADSWVLVDAGWPGDGDRIAGAAERVFGVGAAASGILLTHAHPDHEGDALVLATRWGCPILVGTRELPIAKRDFEVMKRTAMPLDRWLVLPLMQLLGRRRRQQIFDRASLAAVARGVEPGSSVPGLPGWIVVPTPGHTQGHVAYFRASDRVLLSGDALVTAKIDTIRGLLLRRTGLSGPPWYTTWNRDAAEASMLALARLKPRVLGGGHGRPLTGPDTADRVAVFASAVARQTRRGRKRPQSGR